MESSAIILRLITPLGVQIFMKLKDKMLKLALFGVWWSLRPDGSLPNLQPVDPGYQQKSQGIDV